MPIYDLRNGELIELNSEEEAEFLASLPPPPRRLIPKSTVTARLIALGKAAQAKAALDAAPELYFRWVSPDWPEVYADDEGLLYVLGPDVLDLTPEQIATVTAP